MCNEFFNNIRCKGGLLRRHAWLGFVFWNSRYYLLCRAEQWCGKIFPFNIFAKPLIHTIFEYNSWPKIIVTPTMVQKNSPGDQ